MVGRDNSIMVCRRRKAQTLNDATSEQQTSRRSLLSFWTIGTNEALTKINGFSRLWWWLCYYYYYYYYAEKNM